MAKRLPPANFTAVPNELIDSHLPELSCSELKVILVLLRNTRGWHRDTHTISLAEMAQKTGMSRASCSTASDSLESRGLVSKAPQKTSDGAISATEYEVVFDGENEGGGVQPAEQGCSAHRTGGVQPTEHHKEERKQEERKKEYTPLPLSEEKTPNEPLTSRDVILYMNSRKGCRLSQSQRRYVDEYALPSGITIEAAAALFDREFESGGFRRQRLQSAPRREQRPQFTPRRSAAVAAPLVGPEYPPDPQYDAFVAAYEEIGAPYAPPDKPKGRPFWEAMSPEHRALAIQRIRLADPNYVKFLPRWLEAQDYVRRPRPAKEAKPMTNNEKFHAEMEELCASKGMVWKGRS